MATYMYPNEVTVTIAAAGSASTSGTNFTTRLSNFQQTGGNTEIESVPLFGGAFIDVEKPRELIEVSFDCVITYEQALLFDQLTSGSVIDGSTGPVAVGSTEPVGKAIYLQWNSGGSFYTRAYNNARAVMFEPEMSADEYLKGTITFKLTAADGSGSTNLKVDDVAASTITW